MILKLDWEVRKIATVPPRQKNKSRVVTIDKLTGERWSCKSHRGEDSEHSEKIEMPHTGPSLP